MEPRYEWDAISARYRNLSNGRYVSSQTVNAWMTETTANAGRSMRELTQLLRQGDVTLKAWQLELTQNVRLAHISNAAAAKGGLAQLTTADYARVEANIARELKYLDAFAKGIADGSVPLDGRVLARADAYMKASKSTYWDTLRREMVKRGMTEERRVLSGSESCDDCIEYAGRGWVPIGTNPVPGQDSVCRQNCLCVAETR